MRKQCSTCIFLCLFFLHLIIDLRATNSLSLRQGGDIEQRPTAGPHVADKLVELIATFRPEFMINNAAEAVPECRQSEEYAWSIERLSWKQSSL